MLVNQEVLFHKLCGEEIADMPHAPVGDAKQCIEELRAPPNARSVRRRSSLQRGSREARLALNQHAFNSRINGIPVPALPGPAGKDDKDLAEKWIGPNYSDKETSDVLKCRMLMNQTALFNCMCAIGNCRAGLPLWKWKKMTSRASSQAPSRAPTRSASVVDIPEAARVPNQRLAPHQSGAFAVHSMSLDRVGVQLRRSNNKVEFLN